MVDHVKNILEAVAAAESRIDAAEEVFARSKNKNFTEKLQNSIDILTTISTQLRQLILDLDTTTNTINEETVGIVNNISARRRDILDVIYIY